jgi:type IV pilus assembly protein PilV
MSHPARFRPGHRGFSLVEVLVAIVIFALGVLGIVKLQASAVKMSTDARQRAEATFLVDQLLARMLISDRAQAAAFQHKPNGTVACAPTGAESANLMVLDWLAQVRATFPRAAVGEQQIVVTGPFADLVTVRLCWKNSDSDPPHTMEVTNRVQWP